MDQVKSLTTWELGLRRSLVGTYSYKKATPFYPIGQQQLSGSTKQQPKEQSPQPLRYTNRWLGVEHFMGQKSRAWEIPQDLTSQKIILEDPC